MFHRQSERGRESQTWSYLYDDNMFRPVQCFLRICDDLLVAFRDAHHLQGEIMQFIRYHQVKEGKDFDVLNKGKGVSTSSYLTVVRQR